MIGRAGESDSGAEVFAEAKGRARRGGDFRGWLDRLSTPARTSPHGDIWPYFVGEFFEGEAFGEGGD